MRDSEYLETHLVAVPAQQAKDFPKAYETISPWVVPRSAVRVDSDSEFTLFAVTTFKKHSAEFVHKCREKKWTPRDYRYAEGGREAEQRELEKVRKEERQLWGEVLRLARIDWGEAVMAWVHVLALRVFVETVLRYGLPLSFVSGLVQVGGRLGFLGPRLALTRARYRRSWRKRCGETWTSPTAIWPATPSGGTSAARRSRMRAWRPWFQDRATASIQRTFVTNSKSFRAMYSLFALHQFLGGLHWRYPLQLLSHRRQQSRFSRVHSMRCISSKVCHGAAACVHIVRGREDLERVPLRFRQSRDTEEGPSDFLGYVISLSAHYTKGWWPRGSAPLYESLSLIIPARARFSHLATSKEAQPRLGLSQLPSVSPRWTLSWSSRMQ